MSQDVDNYANEAVERELRGLQEMLYFVLESVGEPVVVTKEQLKNGAGPDKMINIEDDVENGRFVFSIVEVEPMMVEEEEDAVQ